MIKPIVCVVVSALALSACSTTPAWKTAKAASPLTIPAGVDTPGTSNELVVPKLADTADKTALLRNTRPPATNQEIVLAKDPDAEWEDVGKVLTEAGVGKIVARDAAKHSYRLDLSAAEVDPGHRGFWYRLKHRTPDLSGVHEVTVRLLDDGKGRSNVTIDGDDLAVAKIYQVLKAASASAATVSADAKSADLDSKTKKD